MVFGVILVAATQPGMAAPAAEAPQRVGIQAVFDGGAEPRPAVVIFQGVLGDTAGREEITIPVPGVIRVPIPAAGDAFRLHLVSDVYWAADQILPRGALDLRLKGPGFIPHYLFDRVIDPDEALVLGSLPLAVGA